MRVFKMTLLALLALPLLATFTAAPASAKPAVVSAACAKHAKACTAEQKTLRQAHLRKHKAAKVAAAKKAKLKQAKAAKAAKLAKAHKVAKTKVAKRAQRKPAVADAGGPTLSGVASWYGGYFHGRTTANGERYDMWAMTAAHKTLPFGTRVRVTNTRNGNSVTVRINDRGPYIAGRIIDLSRAAAGQLGLTDSGVAPVKVTILGRG